MGISIIIQLLSSQKKTDFEKLFISSVTLIENTPNPMLRKIYLTGLICLFLFNVSNSQTVGLINKSPGSLDGYVLFPPMFSDSTFLIDKCGYLIKTWTSQYNAGLSAYLLEDGTMIRAGKLNNTTFSTGGQGGIIERFDWNGNIIWSYEISSSTECQHHDFHVLPNGNILVLVWELKTRAEVLAAGRDSAITNTTIWMEKVVELQPFGTNSANIVWEWKIWDHLIQDYDSLKPNYGVVRDHPELLNLNSETRGNKDWLHCNSVDYNQELDQIIISVHGLNEFWIIDHSTTTAQAATHTGGTHNKGGDFLYRWGSPNHYNRGTLADTKLWGQHNAQWIRNGLNDAGKILVFNNGFGNPDSNFSSVDIINPPVNSFGDYTILPNLPYGPDSAEWSYKAPIPTTFYSSLISGAQRLSNGNTMVSAGQYGNFFEIDPSKNKVWDYVNPVTLNGIVMQGDTATLNMVFRCAFYEPNYAGLQGRVLIAGDPIEINPTPYVCNMTTSAEENFIPLDHIQIYNSNKNGINFSVTKDQTNAQINVYDITGKIVFSKSGLNLIKNEKYELGLNSTINDGLYTILIFNSIDRLKSPIFYLH